MLKKTKLSKDDWDWLLESKLLHMDNTSGRIAADLIRAGNDYITALWYSHIWWMIDQCQHYIDLDSQEMRNKLEAIWGNLRHEGGLISVPFPRLLLDEDVEGNRDFVRVYKHVFSERQYLMEMIYELE